MKSEVKSNNFDHIAFIYDWLASVVFGKAIRQSQPAHLHMINDGAEILILGGGTGHILKQLDALNKPLIVHYVEASAKMIRKASNREPFKNLKVEFVHSTHDEIQDRKHDVIITAFFLDVFDEARLPSEMSKIRSWLKDGGYWFFTDFMTSKVVWQKWLLRFMYLFFGLTSNLESKKLPDFHGYFEELDLKLVKEERFYRGMISSCVFGLYPKESPSSKSRII